MASALMSALSSFWHRCFADVSKLEPLYEGAEAVVADAYAELLATVASASVTTAPLPWVQRPRLLSLSELDMRLEADGFVSFPLPVNFGLIRYLQSTPASAKRNLRPGEFRVEGGRIFVQATLLSDASVARRVAVKTVAGTIRAGELELPTLPAGAQVQVVFTAGARQQTLTISADTQSSGARVLGVASESVPAKAGAATLTYGAVTGAVTVTKTTTLDYTVWALWAVDADYDGFYLYRTYGHMLGARQPSTEAYRSFVRGVMQLQLLGPAVARLEAGLCAVAGLPVVATEGETVSSVTTASGVTTVVTDASTYRFPSLYGTLPSVYEGAVLPAFSPLCGAIRVLDNTSAPGWWHNRTLPKTLLPDVTDEARLASAFPYPTNIGPAARWFIGDPTMLVGRAFAYTASFVLMDEVLSNNVFSVDIHPQLQQNYPLFNELRRLVVDNKPAHTFALLRPITDLSDEVVFNDEEDSDVAVFLSLTDTLSPDDGWNVEDPQTFIGQSFSLGADGTYDLTPVEGEGMPVIVGGGYPRDPYTPTNANAGAIGDGAVYVRQYEGVYASPLYTFAQPSGPSITGGSGPTDA